MSERGKLFVLEGPDNVGKTTLTQGFIRYLTSKNIESNYVAFPGRDIGTLGKLVYDLHHNPQIFGVKSVNRTSLQLLHVAAHLDLIESKILPALERGIYVVLDRFWWSTWVYGKVGGANQRSLEVMIDLERSCWNKVLPTVVFLLQRNILYKEVSQDEQQLVDEYKKIAISESTKYPVRHIDNNKTIDETLSEIVREADLIISRSISNGPLAVEKKFYQNQLPLRYIQTNSSSPFVFTKLSPAKPTVVYDTYWRFAAERQAIFFHRLAGEPPPWTEDLIMQDYKFTNVYRASDRVSQYLIKYVIYEGDQSPQEICFRTLLFKFFNKIETWELLLKNLNTISFAEYSFELYDAILNRAVANGTRIYSAAYIMPSGGSASVSGKKHRMHLKLLEQMIKDELPKRLTDACSMKKAFEMLRAYPTIGDFLGYQYITDLNYSTILNFSEMEFGVPGPGARDGIRKCFRDLGGLNETEIIKVVADRQEAEFNRLGLDFQSLFGRPLQLIDCQNLFCEVDKYARIKHPKFIGISGRTRIKQKYHMNLIPLQVWYPPKWGLNERIEFMREYVSSI